jgi:hypothetical protein
VYYFERFCIYSSPDIDLVVLYFHLGLTQKDNSESSLGGYE